ALSGDRSAASPLTSAQVKGAFRASDSAPPFRAAQLVLEPLLGWYVDQRVGCFRASAAIPFVVARAIPSNVMEVSYCGAKMHEHRFLNRVSQVRFLPGHGPDVVFL